MLIGKYEFADADLDRPLTYTAAVIEGRVVQTDRVSAGAWRIRFRPMIVSLCGSHRTGAYSIRFARKRDVELAIEGLRKAGITTARHLLDQEQVERIVGESMAW
jgi:hypothetical protein